MAVKEADREYFRRIAAIKEASHARAAAVHAERSLGDRLRESYALYLAHRDPAAPPRYDDPSPLYDRARRLGLYRP